MGLAEHLEFQTESFCLSESVLSEPLIYVIIFINLYCFPKFYLVLFILLLVLFLLLNVLLDLLVGCCFVLVFFILIIMM